MADQQVRLSSRTLLRFLLFVCLLVVLANCAVLIFREVLGREALGAFFPLFYVSVEQNVPTFFSVLLLLSAVLVSWGAGRVAEIDNVLWKVLAVVFLFLSFDEFAELHERLNLPVRDAFDTSGFIYFAWMLPYFVFVLVLAVFSLRWLLRLPTRTRRLLVVSAVLYVTGALLMEGLSGWYVETVGERRNIQYGALTTVEETCEMLGVIIYIYAVSLHIERDLGGIRLFLGE